MDSDLKSRKQVSVDQMGGLLEFLQEHPDLARGLVRGRRGKLHSLELWTRCARKLNPLKDGAFKDGKGWSKYWCDWKYRVRRKALELKAAKDNNMPPPENTVPLSPMEDCILSLIGDGAVDGVVIKSDPLAEGDIEEEAYADGNNEDASSANLYYVEPKPPKRRKRRHEPELIDLDDSGPSNAVAQKPRLRASAEDPSDSDHDEEAAEFIRLEKEKVENSKRITETLHTIGSELTRIADVMTHIRDALFANRDNLFAKVALDHLTTTNKF